MSLSPFQQYLSSLQFKHQKEVDTQKMEQAQDYLELMKDQLAQHHEAISKQLDIQQQGADLAKALTEMQMQHIANEYIGQNPSLVPQDQRVIQDTGPNPQTMSPVSPPSGPITPQSFGAQAFQASQPTARGNTNGLPSSMVITPNSGILPPDVVNQMGGSVTVNPKQSLDQLAMMKQKTSELGDIQASLAGKTAGSQAAATFPYQEQLAHAQMGARLNELLTKGAIDENIAKMQGQRAINVANIDSNSRIAAAKIGMGLGFGADNGQLFSNTWSPVVDGFYSGQRDLKDLPSKQQAMISNLGTQLHPGWVPPGKGLHESLSAIQGLESIFSDVSDMINKYSVDGTNGGRINAFATEHMGFPSDMKAALDSLKAKGGTLGSVFDQQKRKSDQEILRQVEGVFDPQSTKAQNLERLKTAINHTNGMLRTDFAGMPNDQIDWTLAKNGIALFNTQAAPSFLQNAPPVNKKGQKLNVDASMQHGQPVYQ